MQRRSKKQTMNSSRFVFIKYRLVYYSFFCQDKKHVKLKKRKSDVKGKAAATSQDKKDQIRVEHLNYKVKFLRILNHAYIDI